MIDNPTPSTPLEECDTQPLPPEALPKQPAPKAGGPESPRPLPPGRHRFHLELDTREVLTLRRVLNRAIAEASDAQRRAEDGLEEIDYGKYPSGPGAEKYDLMAARRWMSQGSVLGRMKDDGTRHQVTHRCKRPECEEGGEP